MSLQGTDWFSRSVNYVLYKLDPGLSKELNYIAKEINKAIKKH